MKAFAREDVDIIVVTNNKLIKYIVIRNFDVRYKIFFKILHIDYSNVLTGGSPTYETFYWVTFHSKLCKIDLHFFKLIF